MAKTALIPTKNGYFHTFRQKVAEFVAPRSTTTTRPSLSAGSGVPYEAAGTGRRAFGWNPSRLGPTSNLWSTLDLMRARARDSVRNNPWATSAVDNFEAQIIGKGIRPHWNLDDEKLKTEIEEKFQWWASSTSCDTGGMLNFYGLQALATREIFEAGEVLARMYSRPASFGLPVSTVPLQIQLIEGEQMPVWRNIITGGGAVGVPADNTIRTGIEFDPSGRRAAYHLYKENPGETMLFPLEGLTFIRIPAAEMLHCYKPLRAGQLRGQPYLAPVLGLLLELDQYTDAALVKKKIQTLFAGFITKNDPDSSLLPVTTDNADLGSGIPTSAPPSGVEDVQLEPGTLQNLLLGEQITFPSLPAESDWEMFMNTQLHKFAVGTGMTYEMLTGDLKGVNYSSIRAGLIDFRRRAEQFQFNIIIQQFCAPVVLAWMREAVLSSQLRLPGYAQNPWMYTNLSWATPGWPWVDPLKDVQAAVVEIRSGLTSRETVVAEKGDDAAMVDNQQAADNKRTDKLELIYDSDPRNTDAKGTKSIPVDDAEAVAPASGGSSGSGGGSKKPSLVKTK